MEISNNGISMPDDVDFHKDHKLGFDLINALIMQLNGIIELKKDKITKFIMTFKSAAG